MNNTPWTFDGTHTTGDAFFLTNDSVVIHNFDCLTWTVFLTDSASNTAYCTSLNRFWAFVKVSTLWLNGIFCWNYLNQMLWACLLYTSFLFRIFENIIGNTQFECLEYIFIILIGSEDNDLYLRILGKDLTGGIQPRGPCFHLNVHQDDIRLAEHSLHHLSLIHISF